MAIIKFIKNIKVFLTGIVALSLVLFSIQVSAKDKPLLTNNISTYLTTDGQNLQAKAKQLNNLGYHGAVLNIDGDIKQGLAKLETVLSWPSFKNGDARLSAVKWRTRMRGNLGGQVNTLLQQVNKLKLPLLIELQGKRNQHLGAERFLRKLAVEAAQANVEVVIVPEYNSAVPNLKFATELLKKISADNLTTAVTWQAEVASGTQDRVSIQFEQLKPYISWLVLTPTLESRLMLKAAARQGFSGNVLLDKKAQTGLSSSQLMTSWQSVNVGIANYFGAFDMGSLGELTPLQQTELLVSLGYEAAVPTGWRNLNVDYIIEYFNTPAVKSGKLHVPAAIWVPNVNDDYPPKEKMDRLFTVLKENNAVLWSKARGPKRAYPDKPLAFFQRVADDAAKFGVELVLYPHHNTTFLDVEEAYELMQKVDRANVKISMHMCHELKAGNDARLEQIAEKMAPYIALVSVSGADSDMNRRNDNWDKSIMPLDEGDISNVPMVRGLVKGGYKGPIYLHTYDVFQPVEDHLTRSINKWRQIEREAVQDIAEPSSFKMALGNR